MSSTSENMISFSSFWALKTGVLWLQPLLSQQLNLKFDPLFLTYIEISQDSSTRRLTPSINLSFLTACLFYSLTHFPVFFQYFVSSNNYYIYSIQFDVLY